VNGSLRSIYNGSAIAVADIPVAGSSQFLQSILDATDHGWRVISYFGMPEGADIALFCVLANKAEGRLAVTRTAADGTTFPSIATLCPQLQLFEREIAEQCGLTFVDHPWFKPVRFHRPFCSGHDAWDRSPDEPLRVGVMNYFQVAGDEVHEVAVGPVHAGIIEPGAFPLPVPRRGGLPPGDIARLSAPGDRGGSSRWAASTYSPADGDGCR